jgi:hypothetical protein
MTTERNLDEELEAQLAVSSIPEDEVDLGENLIDNANPRDARSTTSGISPDWWEVGSADQDPRTETALSRPKSANRGKKFLVRLLLPGDDVCMKIVGDESSFCVAVRCQTNHAGSAPTLKLEEPLLVILNTKERAFVDLTLSGSLVPDDVLTRWEGTSRTLEVWHEAFLAVGQDEDQLEVEAGFESRILEVQRAELFKTPGKRRPGAPSGLDTFVPYPSALRNSGTKEQLRKNPLNFSKLGDTVVAIDEGLVGLGSSFRELVLESREAAAVHSEAAKMLFLKLARVDNLVGNTSVMVESEYAAPTVWSSIASIGADVQSLLKRKVQLPEVDLKPLEARALSIEVNLKTSTDKIKIQIVGLAGGISARVGKVEKAVARLNTMESKVDKDLEAALMSSKGEQTFGAGPSANQDLHVQVERLQTIVQELDIRLRQVMADNETDCVKFGGLGLRSEVETGAWIMANFQDMHYALIFDVYGVLEAIEDEGAMNQSELLRDMKKRDDLSINGIAAGQALTAHLHEIPRIFHSPSGKVVGLDSTDTHLSKIPSYKHWSHGAHCLKRKIETELVKVRYGNRIIIQRHFKPGTAAYSIAMEALDKSVTWVTGLLSFIDRTYEALHVGSKFTVAQAWSLTSQLVRRIFSDLHTARMGTTRTMGKDRVVSCTTLLWSAFKTHDAMAAFENANFEDHPSISSEYVKFLEMNSGFEALEAVTGKIKVMHDQMKEFQGSVKQADKKAENAVSYCETNKKAVGALEKRIGIQEAKK